MAHAAEDPDFIPLDLLASTATMAALAAESPLTNYALDKLRVMNGLYPDGEPEPGQLIKIID